MTADEYFDKIKAVQKRRVSLERAIKEEKNRIYDISGIDPSKEKVSGGRTLDIGDKLIQQDELLTALYKEFSPFLETAWRESTGCWMRTGRKISKRQMFCITSFLAGGHLGVSRKTLE